jgi:hypothetical protein
MKKLTILTLVIGPTGLWIAWSLGFTPAGVPALLAAAPPILGAGLGLLRRPAFILDAVRRVARFTSRGVLTRERGAMSLLARLGQGASSPLRDLHTGDAQEYLLFLVGVAVLALLLPLLQ